MSPSVPDRDTSLLECFFRPVLFQKAMAAGEMNKLALDIRSESCKIPILQRRYAFQEAFVLY